MSKYVLILISIFGIRALADSGFIAKDPSATGRSAPIEGTVSNLPAALYRYEAGDMITVIAGKAKSYDDAVSMCANIKAGDHPWELTKFLTFYMNNWDPSFFISRATEFPGSRYAIWAQGRGKDEISQVLHQTSFMVVQRGDYEILDLKTTLEIIQQNLPQMDKPKRRKLRPCRTFS